MNKFLSHNELLDKHLSPNRTFSVATITTVAKFGAMAANEQPCNGPNSSSHFLLHMPTERYFH
eukprot:m.313118 g.313118  ORF g.313118 m.313118 type:complete len:63 (+) comp351192_c0_seq1:118-306(+)